MRKYSVAILGALSLATLLLGCDGGDDDDDGGLGQACATNADCEADLYCEKAVGQCDDPGTCQDRPAACPAVEAPVCGCDAVTYGNSCIAAGSGASVRSVGPCP